MEAEQALAEALKCGDCFVTFRQDNGEVLKVVPCDSSAGTAYFSHVEELRSAPVPVKGRFFRAGALTKAVLDSEIAEAHAVARRVQTYRAWSLLGAPGLVALLEAGAATDDISPDHGQPFAIRTLFDLRRKEISKDLRMRLLELSRTRQESQGLPLLEIGLAGLASDSDRLLEIWNREIMITAAEAIMREAGRIRSTDPRIILRLGQVVETPGFFQPRFSAMVALGRIGSAARGTHQAITASVHDSSDWVTSSRNRVVERLTTPAREWRRCPGCEDGTVEEVGKSGIARAAPCSRCLEMGFLREIP